MQHKTNVGRLSLRKWKIQRHYDNFRNRIVLFPNRQEIESYKNDISYYRIGKNILLNRIMK